MHTFLSADSAFATQRRVLGALILRDMRTRHGRTFFGFVFIILIPLLHLLALMLIFMFIRGRGASIGTSVAVFSATGLLPYILFVYPTRMITGSLTQNRPLLFFPIVTCFDVVLARGVLEILTAFWVTAIFCIILALIGVDIMPLNMFDAMSAILATIYLGFAFGWIGAIAFTLTRVWIVFQIVLLFVMYFTSGVFFVPASLPQHVQYYVWFNPLLHAVEWLRSAYSEGYGYGLLDRGYLFAFPTVLLFVGLAMERAVRGRLMQQ